MNITEVIGKLQSLAEQDEIQELRQEIERLTKIVNEQKAEIERLVIQLEDPHKP